MAGDSVTDCGRNRELPPCFWSTWGDGYVHVVYSALLSFAPQKSIFVANAGISGDTSAELLSRWDKDVMDLNPDYVSIMIGINDVWRHFDSCVRQAPLVSKEDFSANLHSIMDKTLNSKSHNVKKVFLLTPVMWELNKNDPMRAMKDEYDKVIESVAKDYNQVFVNCQKKADKVLEYQSSYMFTMDRVHPNLPGHFIIAKAFLDSIGFNINGPN